MSTPNVSDGHADFLEDGGEMGALVRAFDWAATPLGPIASWPTALRTTIGLILRSPVPIVTLWGEAGTMIYNDAYSGFAGRRHPQLLGSAVREGWPEVASFNDNVMKVGLAGGVLSYRDQELTLERSGVPEQVFMDLDYSPVLGNDGKPIGIIAIVVETTARILAERDLERQAQQRAAEQEHQRRLFEQAPGFIIIMRGPQHVVEFVNDAHRTAFGSGDWIGYTIRDAFPSIAGQGFYEVLDRVYRTGEVFEASAAPVRYRRGKGQPIEIRHLTFFYAPLFGDDGAVTGVFCEGFDVTAGHRAQRRIAMLAALGDRIREIDDPEELAYAAEECLGEELGVSRVGYGTINTSDDTLTVTRDWNAPGVKSIAGTLNLRDFGSFVDDLKHGRFIAISDVVLDPRTASAAENLIGASARSFVNVAVVENNETVAVFYVNDDKVRLWSSDELDLIREVAERTRTAVERRRAEAALRANEARLRFLDALGKETASSTDADEILATTTRMLGQHLGVAICAYADIEDDGDHFTIRGDWTRDGLASIVGYYSLADFGQLAVRNLGAGRPLIVNDVGQDLDPHEAATFRLIGIAATICMPLVKQGRLTALMAVHESVPRVWTDDELALLTEVTERSWAHIERVRAEAATLEGAAQFRTFAQAMPNHVWTAPADGQLDWFNDQVYAYSGAQPGDLDGPGWAAIVHPDDAAFAIESWLKSLREGSPYQVEFRLRRHDGVWRWHLARAVPLRDANGQIVRWIGTNTDVDDQKNSETLLEARLAERTAALVETSERLQQAQKMEALGSLTGGIAHDFNNLLMAVMGSLELLRRRMPDEPTLTRLVDNAMEGAQRGSALTRRMLTFARRQDLKSRRIDLAELVEGMTELMQRSLGPMIAIETDFEDGLASVETDANQLESAILNLVVNARDAMSGEGRITIAGRTAAVGGHDPALAPGRYVCLSVADTGHGMDEATLKRATEPFFTTKDIGKGTGLGLSMVHGLAEQSGGVLRLRSAVGKGTTAELWLPAVDGDAEPASAAVAEPSGIPDPQRLSLRVLAVDDDALVLMNTSAMLEDLGHEVIEARSGSEALAALEEDSFDLVVTDHAMPRMTGAQLAAEIARRWPDVRVVLATGYAELPAGSETGLPRLSKPFTQADLARILAAT